MGKSILDILNDQVILDTRYLAMFERIVVLKIGVDEVNVFDEFRKFLGLHIGGRFDRSVEPFCFRLLQDAFGKVELCKDLAT